MGKPTVYMYVEEQHPDGSFWVVAMGEDGHLFGTGHDMDLASAKQQVGRVEQFNEWYQSPDGIAVQWVDKPDEHERCHRSSQRCAPTHTCRGQITAVRREREVLCRSTSCSAGIDDRHEEQDHQQDLHEGIERR